MHTWSADDTERRPPHLVIEGLVAGYGNTPIVSNISLEVGQGEIVSVLGPNGAGKSTLLKALVGILSVTEGRVHLDGENITNLPTDQLARKGVGYVPQVKDAFDILSVQENLEMGGYLLEPRAVAGRMAEVLGMFPSLNPLLGRTAGKLSGGERKTLAMARVLMLKPSVLILDEPTASMSPELATTLLRDHVRRLANMGTAILLVEQKATAALEISNWAYVLVSGSVRLSGSPQQLMAQEDFGEVFLGRGIDVLEDVTL